MKTILLLTFAALSSCASTTIYGTDGRPIFRTQADMSKTEFARASDGSTRWTADNVNHSTPTTAGGNAVSKGILSGGTAYATAIAPAVIK